jgi:hypothetical protein
MDDQHANRLVAVTFEPQDIDSPPQTPRRQRSPKRDMKQRHEPAPPPQAPPPQELDERDTWQSCCLKTDRQAVIYLGQMTIAFSVLAFSGAMLVTANGNCEKSSPYIGLISFILGKLLSSVTDSTHR